jgi:ribosome-binding factor A
MNTESKRQQKFSRMLKEELSTIFQRDLQHAFTNTFITITMVRVSPDLSIARVYLSFLSTNNQKSVDILDKIEEKNKTIRQFLAQRIGKAVRIIPHLQFFIDDSAEYAAKMDALFANLNIPPVDTNEENKIKK